MTINRILLVLALVLASSLFAPAFSADDYLEANRLYKLGNRSGAMQRIEAELARNPQDLRARFLKGVILTEQNKPQEAIGVFTGLTEDFPELPEPYNNLAVLYAGQGNFDQARKALEMAIRTHPSYAVAHENLGDVYATLASQAYDKALQLDSKNNTARKKLALIKEVLPVKSAAVVAPAAAVQASSAVAGATTASQTATAPQTTTSSLSPTVEDQTAAVLKMLEAWVTAWSGNDAEGYLNSYAPEFRPPGGESRAKWEANRRARLAKPKKIQVSATSPKVKFTDNSHATVTFRQNYSSGSLKTAGTKTLYLVKLDGRWLIQKETLDK